MIPIKGSVLHAATLLLNELRDLVKACEDNVAVPQSAFDAINNAMEIIPTDYKGDLAYQIEFCKDFINEWDNAHAEEITALTDVYCAFCDDNDLPLISADEQLCALEGMVNDA